MYRVEYVDKEERTSEWAQVERARVEVMERDWSGYGCWIGTDAGRRKTRGRWEYGEVKPFYLDIKRNSE